MGHELGVDEGVEDFGDDWEDGDRAVVFWQSLVFFLVDGGDAGEFEFAWVNGLVSGVVECCGDDGSQDFVVVFC